MGFRGGMGGIFLITILTVVMISCHGRFLSSPQAITSGDSPWYCDLLYMPSGPYPVILPKPYLGIYLSSGKVEQTSFFCKENTFVQVAGVIDRTPAEEAGLKEGDVILSLNGELTCETGENMVAAFRGMVEKQPIDSIVALEVLRNAQRLIVNVKLSAMQSHEQREAVHQRIGECPEQRSMLENALYAQGVNAGYSKIMDGLYEKSNTVHNPGLTDERESHPLQLSEITYMMRHPLLAGEVSKELTQKLVIPSHEKDWNMGILIRETVRLTDSEMHATQESARITFPALRLAMETTKDNVEKALSSLTSEEKTMLREKALNPWDDHTWHDVLRISMKVNRAQLLGAFSPLLAFLTRDNLSQLKEDLISRFGQNEREILYESMTAMGKIIVAGSGPNVFNEDAALILDLGGDDLYLNNAGGTRPGIPLALVIDWEGNDRYLSRENFSQGTGLLGGGFLIDMGGDDTFVSMEGSQGGGFWGMGVLYHGVGRSTYTARSYCQGVGQMGVGLLIDRKGDDLYHCSFSGQGLGLFGGAGILIDEGGNDFYQLGGLKPDFRDPLKATVSKGQGFGYGIRAEKGIQGVPGGMGILMDGEGNDTYVADYFAQGASYYYGLGILDDRDGNDRYVSGRYAQGAGIHSSVGVLMDRRGSDFYYASFGVAQGMGHDFGVGYLEDERGMDQYWGGMLVQGAATNGSLGIFIDLEGNDQRAYLTNGQGYSEGASSLGIMMTKEGDSPGEAKEVTIKLGVKKE
jgi:hypothetical protein